MRTSRRREALSSGFRCLSESNRPLRKDRYVDHLPTAPATATAMETTSEWMSAACAERPFLRLIACRA